MKNIKKIMNDEYPLIEPINLQLHFVVYADLLGTSQFLNSCEKNIENMNEELTKFLHIFEYALDFLRGTPNSFNGTVRVLSDNCIFTIPMRKDLKGNFHDGRAEIGISIEYIAIFQYILAVNNVFLRGGASIGPIYISESILLGPVLCIVSDIEKKCEYPAIFLAPDITERINKFITSKWPGFHDGFPWIMKDSDGKYFINYLYALIEVNPFNYSNNEERIDNFNYFEYYPRGKEEMMNHKKYIIDRMDNPNIKEKFRWLGYYHNHFCCRYFQGYPELLIDEKLLHCEQIKFFDIC